MFARTQGCAKALRSRAIGRFMTAPDQSQGLLQKGVVKEARYRGGAGPACGLLTSGWSDGILGGVWERGRVQAEPGPVRVHAGRSLRREARWGQGTKT